MIIRYIKHTGHSNRVKTSSFSTWPRLRSSGAGAIIAMVIFLSQSKIKTKNNIRFLYHSGFYNH